MGPAAQRGKQVRLRDRPGLAPHFYYLLAFLVTLGAFWPSFLSKLGSTDAPHLIHGTIEPAMERVFVFYVPGVPGYDVALYLAIITMEVIVLAILSVEWRRKRISRASVLALLFFVANARHNDARRDVDNLHDVRAMVRDQITPHRADRCFWTA